MILPRLVNRLFPDPQLTLTVLPAAPPQEPRSHHLSALALLTRHPAGDRSCWWLQHRALLLARLPPGRLSSLQGLLVAGDGKREQRGTRL